MSKLDSSASQDSQAAQASLALEEVVTKVLRACRSERPPNVVGGPSSGLFDPAGRRLILISCRGLVCDCLHGSLNEYGFEVLLHPLYEALNAPALPVDLIVLCLSECEPKTFALVRQRIDELRTALPDVPVMALIERADRDAIRDLTQLGLAAVVLGSPSVRIAVAAIQFVMLGGTLVTAEIHLRPENAIDNPPRKVASEFEPEQRAVPPNCNFTVRENALLTRLREGMQNKVIAHELGISESTVKVHLRNIMAKLHATNRTQVVYMLAGNRTSGVAGGMPPQLAAMSRDMQDDAARRGTDLQS